MTAEIRLQLRRIRTHGGNEALHPWHHANKEQMKAADNIKTGLASLCDGTGNNSCTSDIKSTDNAFMIKSVFIFAGAVYRLFRIACFLIHVIWSYGKNYNPHQSQPLCCFVMA
ncbi:hypothetical protein DJICPGNB_25600 [Escherichia coli]|nr:hypothetical protein DJICPGNB_25600 [Escherichia coli]